MSHSVAGARGEVRDRDATLRDAQAWASDRNSDVLLVDASVVFGRDHLESAALHAERAQAAGTMVTRSLSMEALLYVAGRRQVAEAIDAAGIRDGTRSLGVVVFGAASPDELLSRMGWSREDGVLAPAAKDPRSLGITEAQEATVSPDRVVDLALERTALVDVLK